MTPLLMFLLYVTSQSRCSRGFTFVHFENVDDVKEAKEQANGLELNGHKSELISL